MQTQTDCYTDMMGTLSEVGWHTRTSNRAQARHILLLLFFLFFFFFQWNAQTAALSHISPSCMYSSEPWERLNERVNNHI